MLFTNLAESIFAMSLRSVFTSVLVYFLLSSWMIGQFTLTRNVLNYISFLVLYVFCFYVFGSGNNLIIHIITICLGGALFYSALLALNYSVIKIWEFARKVWYLIYATLIIELIVVVSGYQGILFDTFPEENRAFGLPAYRSLYNTFANFFDLSFTGLNSITLQAQAYGQFAVMLSILGFAYTQSTFRKSNLTHIIMLIVAPLMIYSISPNITSSIIFICIVSYVFLIKLHLEIYSVKKAIALFFIFVTIIFCYYFADLGFVRTYSFDDLYDIFLNQQIDYMLTRSFSDYVLGVSLDEYSNVAPVFEISYLSYLSISGVIFGLVNLIILGKFTISTLKQIKVLYKNKLVDKTIVEIQVANLLFVLIMFLSSMHFPVITNYLGSLIFIFHLSFGYYLLKVNSTILVERDAELIPG